MKRIVETKTVKPFGTEYTYSIDGYILAPEDYGVRVQCPKCRQGTTIKDMKVNGNLLRGANGDSACAPIWEHGCCGQILAQLDESKYSVFETPNIQLYNGAKLV